MKKVLIVIVVMLLVATGFYFGYNQINHNKDDNKNINNTNSSKVVEMDISDLTFVNSLMINVPNIGSWSVNFNIYQGKKMTISDVPESVILGIGAERMMKDYEPTYVSGNSYDNYYHRIPLYAYSKKEIDGMNYKCWEEYGDCEVLIDTDMLKDSVKRAFGSEKYFQKLDSFQGMGLLNCKLQDNVYYCTNSGGGSTFGDGVAKKIEKAEQDGDYIYIYEKYVYVHFENLEEHYKDSSIQLQFKIYPSPDSETSIVDTVYPYDFENTNSVFDIDESIEKNAITYKHTFKKSSSGTYYWVSTEPIDK